MYLEAGLLYRYNKSYAIYACPANERRLPITTAADALYCMRPWHPGAHAQDLLDQPDARRFLRQLAARRNF